LLDKKALLCAADGGYTMALFGLLKRKKRIKGVIGSLGLEDWWLSTFLDDERKYIENKFQPFGLPEGSLTSGDFSYTSQTAVHLLYALPGWFLKEEERHIAYRLLEKAEELSKSESRVLTVHFLYGDKIELYYRDRDKPQYLEKAVEACKQQIELAPKAADAFKTEANWGDLPLPGHKGYEQLAIILEKQKNYKEAIELCSQAEKQGWAGDWQKRIERCEKKLAKA